MKNNLIPMAEIVGVHGVKGLVKLKILGTDAEALLDYGVFTDESGKKEFEIAALHQHGSIYLAEIENVTDRTAAEKLRGTKFCITRDHLPGIKQKDTFYHVDLIGLAAKYPDGNPLGKILAVANFGAGDLIEIKPLKGASFYVPFSDACVPKVDLAAGEIIVDPPPGLLD
jgi:16S rRNA processing protein RimM